MQFTTALEWRAMGATSVNGDLVDRMVEALRVPSDLLLGFFVSFSRFEYALRAAGFRQDPPKEAEVSWDRFENWLDTLEPAEVAPVLQAGKYLLDHPPKRLVVRDGVPGWEVPGRDGQTDMRFLMEALRRARNNLFHGGKWLTAPELPDRNERVISTASNVLPALRRMPSAENIRYHFELY
ncbi:MAG TPA: hypothetical protein VEU73_13875 [Gemmatimonadales bacterium]|nr:hypothetical protein [Gemmatimonadales bacterium]